MMRYQRIDHDADLRIQVWGETVQALFENAALAVADLIADVPPQAVDQTHQLTVAGVDWPDLMFNWLREILFLWTGKELIVREINQLLISEFNIRATVGTIGYDPKRHQIGSEVKAVTYHQLDVVQGTSRWEAKIIFDA